VALRFAIIVWLRAWVGKVLPPRGEMEKKTYVDSNERKVSGTRLTSKAYVLSGHHDFFCPFLDVCVALGISVGTKSANTFIR